jgi:hypothetical protein
MLQVLQALFDLLLAPGGLLQQGGWQQEQVQGVGLLLEGCCQVGAGGAWTECRMDVFVHCAIHLLVFLIPPAVCDAARCIVCAWLRDDWCMCAQASGRAPGMCEMY